MFTRTSAAARSADTLARCTGGMPKVVSRSESEGPPLLAVAVPVVVACLALLALLSLYTSWQR
jgi:amino acid permease